MTKKIPTFTSLEEIKASVLDESQKLYAEWDEASLRSRVRDYFNRAINDLIITILGFKFAWNKWEVESSSQRNIFLKETLEENVKREFKRIIEENIGSFQLTNQMKKVLVAEYKREVMSELKRGVREQAKNDLRDYIDSLSIEGAIKFSRDTQFAKGRIGE